MNIRDYQSAAMQFLNDDVPDPIKLIHGPLGMANEAGEVLGLYKKHLIYGKPLDLQEVCKEVGDVMWYAARTAHAHGFGLGDWGGSARIMSKADRNRGLLHYPSALAVRTAALLDSAESAMTIRLPMGLEDVGLAVGVIVVRCTQILDRHAVSIIDAMEMNIEKLSKRYPKGTFSASDAMAKADER